MLSIDGSLVVRLLLLLLGGSSSDSFTLLYNTQDSISTQYYDCVYYTNLGVKYCIQMNISIDIHRTFTQHQNCSNRGDLLSFSQLKKMNISSNSVLEWSTSIEQADKYAKYIAQNSSLASDDYYVCNCTRAGVFGKFCEYEYYLNQLTFDQAIVKQTEPLLTDHTGSQYHNNRPCYSTHFECDFGLMCLDWRNICDGKQQCMNGVDEEFCDKLEFNECEEDEYRCVNGMCIPGEYWLDGEYDCMDWSDEMGISVHSGIRCIYLRNIDCDEHVCLHDQYSCGDGQCYPHRANRITNELGGTRIYCYNYRDVNYLCEVAERFSDRQAWTIDGGYCVRFTLSYVAAGYAAAARENKCTFLVKCVLSKNRDSSCNCTGKCADLIRLTCPFEIQYPAEGNIITPYFILKYPRDHHDWTRKITAEFYVRGSIRCRGYQIVAKQEASIYLIFEDNLLQFSRIEDQFCTLKTEFQNGTLLTYRNESGVQFPRNCWNESKTFNHMPYPYIEVYCYRCFSHYRLRDGIVDCSTTLQQDEIFARNQSCSRQQRYRLQCSATELSCLLAAKIGTYEKQCSSEVDEFSYETGQDLSTRSQCTERNDAACTFFRSYIQRSSFISRDVNADNLIQDIESSTKLPFPYYCDSFVDTQSAFDESLDLCRDWVCHRDRYKCLNNQCIPIDLLCDGNWDCADASDEERILIMSEDDYGEHNRAFGSLSLAKELCYDKHNQPDRPFSDLCNIETQYPCFRVQDLGNPALFNVTITHPCISLNQIGDGVMDCIGGLDERNILQCPSKRILGFNFRELSGYCTKYLEFCLDWKPNDSVEEDTICIHKMLAHRHSIPIRQKDFVCFDGQHIPDGHCDKEVDCDHGEDEYWCIDESLSRMFYRDRDAIQIPTTILSLPTYRKNEDSYSSKRTENLLVTASGPSNIFVGREKTTGPKLRSSIFNFMDTSLPEDYITFEKHYLPFVCNHGLAVMDENEETTCFCPPSFYGSQCEFFSDRITVETHLDFQYYDRRHDSSVLLKVLTTFLFRDQVIDYYEFHVYPSLQTEENFVKQKIYFLYPRTEEFLLLKRMNRSGAQLYSVRFEAFELSANGYISLAGVWHYPMYFDFLPAYRLAKILRFPPHPPPRIDLHSERRCDITGTYHPVNNRNDSYFCHCRSGSHGQNCEFLDDSCTNYCAAGSICKPEYCAVTTGNQQPLCLCAADSFGPTCHLKNTACSSNPCINLGSCFVSYDPQNIQEYFCVCTGLFRGKRCEIAKASIHIKLNTTLLTTQILASTVQYYDIENEGTMDFILRHQAVYAGIPPAISLYHDRSIAPFLGVIKLYETTSKSQVSAYFILYIQKDDEFVNITSQLSNETHCPNVRTLWHLIVPENTTFKSTTAVFKYHQICRANQTMTSPLGCFHDDEYLCICENDYYRVECFGHDPASDRCSLCLANGYCLKGDLTTNQTDFICLCPRCHHGQLCQFSTELMSFTLDSLMVKDIQANHKLSVGVYVSLILLVFLFASFNNLSSILTFVRPNPRKFGVGNYLLFISIINQFSFSFLLAKVIHIILGSSGTLVHYSTLNLFSCKIISYLLSVFTRINYWLTSLVAIERLSMVLFPTSQIFKKPRLAFGMFLFTIVAIAGMHLHEAFYYTTVIDPSYTTMKITLCVTNYADHIVSLYNRVNLLIHYFAPFLIQILCITILIIKTALSRHHAITGQQTFMSVFRKQFNMQKEQYVTPIIIIFSALPQAILSFTYACTELKQAWQRYLLLAAYLLSYLPQILGFVIYVLPSTTYRIEFQQTFIGRRLMKKKK